MGKRRLLLGIFLGLSLTAAAEHVGPAAARETAEARSYSAKARRVARLFEFVGKNDPGCSVNVVKEGVSVYKGSFGVLRVDDPVPATPDTRYNLASATKPIVALAVMKLREELLAKGRGDLLQLRLGSIFQKHERYPEKGGPSGGLVSLFEDETVGRATVRHLLTHSSGLAGTGPYQWAGLSDRSLVDRIARRENVTYFNPGEYYMYSNAGYAVLGAIIEELTGMSLEQYLQDRFFRPLGMTRTSIRHPAHYVEAPDVAWGHELVGGRIVKRPFVDQASGTLGDGGMFSTVEDLEKLMVALDDAQNGKSTLLSAESVRLAFQSADLRRAEFPEPQPSRPPYPVAAGSVVNYGLGWKVYPSQLPQPPDQTTLYQQWHDGYYAGSRSMLARAQRGTPPCRLNVILLCNGPGPTTYQLADDIQQIYCPR